ncbi:hypothetical protein V497_00922 [Pseudogymnoascus sp. VKM F-4516 (FW-969)]|nr:hypothetical protein V497_00922 [Pseudogymnoascus sp. VKM F-4516 (FW-969)]
MWRPTRPIWQYLVVWAVICLVFLYELDLFKENLERKPAQQQWAVDLQAGCPAGDAAPSQDSNTDAKLARPLSAAELLCRPLPTDRSTVPKLLHQSWKTHELPTKFKKWSTVCREKHEDWEWVLWSNDDNLNLVKKYFPWLEETYLALPGDIFRADFSRNLYMYIFGGVYVDLDTDCLRTTTSVFEAYDLPHPENLTAGTDDDGNINQFAVFGRMGDDDNFSNSIPNAWMASSPGHPFFLMPLLSVQRKVEDSKSFLYWVFHRVSAENWTGPAALFDAIRDFTKNGLSKKAAALAAAGPFAQLPKKTEQEIVLLPEQWVYPYNWRSDEMRPLCSVELKTFDPKACQAKLEVAEKGSISITYWSHTHSGTSDHAKNIDRISHRDG